MSKIKSTLGAILSLVFWGNAKAQEIRPIAEVSTREELDEVIERIGNVDSSTLSPDQKLRILEELKASGLVEVKYSAESSDTTGWQTSK